MSYFAVLYSLKCSTLLAQSMPPSNLTIERRIDAYPAEY